MSDIEVDRAGTAVHALVGDRVVIRVPEQSGGGYQWEPGEIGAGLRLESNLMTPNLDRPGAAGQRVIVLRAVAPGPAPVELRLRRVWESAPIEYFRVEVSVAQG